ncbi:MAG: type I 3-dehydroquinate dehydratase [Candidatus Ranarchaeia archaeon]
MLNIKICSVIYGNSIGEIKSASEKAKELGADLIEIRLDLSSPKIEISKCDNFSLPIILTRRLKEEGGLAEENSLRKNQIIKSLSSQANFVDVEISFAETISQELNRKNGEIIFSKHWTNFPEIKELEVLLEKYGEKGFIKLIPTASKMEQELSILKFIKESSEKGYKLISFCMGDKFNLSRILSPVNGAQWTYASLGNEVAPGQIQTHILRRIYDEFMD